MRQRLQKLLAAAGVASRRGAERFLREGRVCVNGKTATLGDSADPVSDRVEVDGRRLQFETHVYWLAHKPRGVLSTTRDPQGRSTVLDLLPETVRARVYPVGRLDRDTEGLVLLTNDGEAAQVLLHPRFGSEREYRVTVRGAVEPAVLRRLRRGVELDDGRTGPARVGPARFDPRTDTTTFRLTLREGRKRQIRRSMKALGHPVVRLLRVRVGPLVLGRLAAGAARVLRPEERRALQRHIRHCAEDASKPASGRGKQQRVRSSRSSRQR